jgi:hypothetical protein
MFTLIFTLNRFCGAAFDFFFLFSFTGTRAGTVISDSVWAAYRRTLELGGKSSNVGPGRYKK